MAPPEELAKTLPPELVNRLKLMSFPALKTGPGDSSRSHTADEYIYIEEIGKGIEGYIDLLKPVIV